MGDQRPIVICVGFPPLLEERHLVRLRAVDPRIETVGLPVDPGGDWLSHAPGAPHEEPPVWAGSVAAERRAALARAEVMIALHAPRALDDLAPRLRWLQGVGAGVEQFAAAGLRRDAVVVTNASGLSAASMAEWVIGRLLQLWKRFPEAEAAQRQHRFVRTYGRTFAGSVLGIVGLGHIGRALADRARALGVRVLGLRRGFAPGESSPHADELFGPADLHRLLSRSDAVVIAAPATPETRHLIDARALAAMRPGAVLVNVARGSLLDERAVVEALESGRLGAAVLDVFEQEPLPPESPLWAAPNCFVSAHSSASVDRYVDEVLDLFLENLRRYVAGQPLRNTVDMAALGFR